MIILARVKAGPLRQTAGRYPHLVTNIKSVLQASLCDQRIGIILCITVCRLGGIVPTTMASFPDNNRTYQILHKARVGNYAVGAYNW